MILEKRKPCSNDLTNEEWAHLLARRLGQGFQVIPKRWIVERTFAWLGQYRRLSKDYEELPRTSEMLVYMAMTRLMLKQLHPK